MRLKSGGWVAVGLAATGLSLSGSEQVAATLRELDFEQAAVAML
jgi:hypothetical protein